MMTNNGIVFSLRRKHITIRVREYIEFKEFGSILRKKLPEARILYKNSEPDTISIIGRDFSEKEQKIVKKMVSKFFVGKVKFNNTEKLGLYGIRKPFKKEIAVSETKFYTHSLRSGQKVEFVGSIVILGDVNNGAEVIAGENIIILGTLRGLAHAGAKGNKEAIISAGAIETNQIRISNVIRKFDKNEFENALIKTNAYLDNDDKIIVE